VSKVVFEFRGITSAKQLRMCGLLSLQNTLVLLLLGVSLDDMVDEAIMLGLAVIVGALVGLSVG